MAKQPEFDLQAAHRYFSAHCFNSAWDLIDKPERTAEDNETMLQLSLASTWHWTQRPDCTPTNLSTGYWQTSRIYALLGQADNARRYGMLSLQTAEAGGVPPFFLAYAYEALARAEMVAGNRAQMEAHLALARETAGRVKEAEERQLLEGDLDTLRL